jgi:proline iminopeptidase
MSYSTPNLFPSIRPRTTECLNVEDGQSLYIESYGNPEGIPAVFLHGGPGSGCSPDQARLFDPKTYHVILFDQRGSGRSTPRRILHNNTTQHLISDMELIRQKLSIDKWALVGGSWGSTLAVAYAERYPERVSGIILRAIFLGTLEETQWAFGTGPQTFHPDLWAKFTNLVPIAHKQDPIPAFGKFLESPDPRVHLPAAEAWSQFERMLSSLVPVPANLPSDLSTARIRVPATTPNTPFIEWHYIKNNWFLGPNQLMREATHLTGIPGILIQGRYDMLCPPTTAYDLSKRWPDAELRIIPSSGHSATEPRIRTELIRAITDLKERIVLYK